MVLVICMQAPNITNLPFLLWVARSDTWQVTECSNALLQACAYADASPVGGPLSALIGTRGADEVKNWSDLQNGTDSPLQLRATIHMQAGTVFSAAVSVARIKNSEPASLAFFALADTRVAAAEPQIATATADQAKFDALAIIAQGMGHEINNPLQIILGNAEYLLTLNKDAALSSALQDILSAGERIKSAVANLKDFVRTEEK